MAQIEVPSFSLIEMKGYWRFHFKDGGVLDWQADGTLKAHGKLDARSLPHLKKMVAEGSFHPSRDVRACLKMLTERIAQCVPSKTILRPVVPEISIQREEHEQCVLFLFSDGTRLTYYPEEGTLVVQGASNATYKALMDLPTPFHTGEKALIQALNQLFPDANITLNAVLRNLNWRDFWPSERSLRAANQTGKPCQEALLDDWGSAIAHNQGIKHLIAHAPTGLGKTLSSLLPALAWVAKDPQHRRIYYLVNRVAQHENPIQELKGAISDRFHELTGQPLKVVDIIGRDALCAHPESRSPLDPLCKQSKEKADFDQLPAPCSSWSEVARYLEGKACPYHTLQALMSTAHVVICDYWWLFSEKAHRTGAAMKAGLSPKNSLLIVDEAHNLSNRVRAEFGIDESVDAISRHFETLPNEIADVLGAVVRAVCASDPSKGVSPSDLLPLVGGKSGAEKLLTDIEDADLEMALGISEKILQLLLLPDDDVVIYPARGLDDEERLVFQRINYFPVLEKGYGSVYASLTMSGTLTGPADDATEIRYQIPLFGLPLEKTIARKYASPFQARNQVWMFCSDSIGTYTQRERYIPHYVQRIMDIGQAIPEGVTAVFFSSYSFLNQIFDVLPEAERELVVRESRADAGGSELGSVSSYEKRLQGLVTDRGRAYLFAVYQGRLAEGANFRGNLIKAVVGISIPLEYPGLVHQRLESLYARVFEPLALEVGDDPAKKAHEYGYDRLSLSLILQACGRGIRSEGDRCAFILLDRRYQEMNWRRFLAPPPYHVARPEKTLASFFTPHPESLGGAWDPILVAASPKEA